MADTRKRRLTWIERCQAIAYKHQAARIPVYDKDGKKSSMMVDATTANVAVRVYESINTKNQKRLLALGPKQGLLVCWQMVK